MTNEDALYLCSKLDAVYNDIGAIIFMAYTPAEDVLKGGKLECEGNTRDVRSFVNEVREFADAIERMMGDEQDQASDQGIKTP